MLIAFVPVLHKGYLELFKQYPEELGILGLDVIADYTSLTRDLRLVDPQQMKQAIDALGIFKTVRVLGKQDLETPDSRLQIPDSRFQTIVMPDEDVSRELAAKYFSGQVTFASIAIRNRWDKNLVAKENTVAPDRVISTTELDRELMRQATAEAEKSADWWRQVGALLVKNGAIIAQNHNRHLPTDFHLAQNGDPRSNFNAGERLDIATAIHAEAAMLAKCAKDGISTNGASAFVTTFPCPNCARLLATSGIAKVYYQKGYSLLDAEEILKVYGIEIILVN